MRSAAIAVAAAVTLSVMFGACGGSNAGSAEQPSGGSGPFVDRAGFSPTAFQVDVRGEGRPVIFIPGLACPGAIWDDAVERIGKRVEGGIQAHVLTLAGFAGTKPIRPPLAAKTRRELVRYIRSRGLDRPIIVGHSLGGFIAYWLAATAPDLLGGVVVVDAGPALAAADDEDARRLRNMWAQSGDDELPVQIKTVYSWMTRRVDRLAPYFDAIARSDRQTIGDTIYELVKTDVTDKLRSIEAPLLLVLADGGFQRHYRKVAAAVPDHEVVVLPKTRHFVMFDDPDGFARVVGTFINAADEE